MSEQQESTHQAGDQHWHQPAGEHSTDNAHMVSMSAMELPQEQIDRIAAEMDLLPMLKVFNLAAKLARLAPNLRRMRGKGYDLVAITAWLNQQGMEASISSVSKAISVAGKPSAKLKANGMADKRS